MPCWKLLMVVGLALSFVGSVWLAITDTSTKNLRADGFSVEIKDRPRHYSGHRSLPESLL